MIINAIIIIHIAITKKSRTSNMITFILIFGNTFLIGKLSILTLLLLLFKILFLLLK